MSVGNGAGVATGTGSAHAGNTNAIIAQISFLIARPPAATDFEPQDAKIAPRPLRISAYFTA
jgi:hypothetical protein